MNAQLAVIEGFTGVEPEVLVHAPFAHKANLTPFASLKPVLPYDLAACTGRDMAFFPGRDKTEALGLWAGILAAKPKTLAMFWPNDWGGKGLKTHIKALGVAAALEAKMHAQMAFLADPQAANEAVWGEWRAKAAPREVSGANGLAAEAGLFSYREADPASYLLLDTMRDELHGNVADFGCGWGYLAHHLLRTHPKIEALHAIDDDARAVARCRANIADARLKTLWADITGDALPQRLDAVVMNPPFHVQGKENRNLGQRFIERAAQSLKTGGALYLVANRHLPYEKTLSGLYNDVTVLADVAGFKVIKARKGK